MFAPSPSFVSSLLQSKYNIRLVDWDDDRGDEKSVLLGKVDYDQKFWKLSAEGMCDHLYKSVKAMLVTTKNGLYLPESIHYSCSWGGDRAFFFVLGRKPANIDVKATEGDNGLVIEVRVGDDGDDGANGANGKDEDES